MSDEAVRYGGIQVVRAGELDRNTAQSLGMVRRAAITAAKAGAQKLWAGTVTIDPHARTGAHHHGDLESVIYVVDGIARLRWGDRLEQAAEARAGDFIFVPPYLPHQELNPGDSLLSCVLVRSGQDNVVVNLEMPEADEVAVARWVDDLHR